MFRGLKGRRVIVTDVADVGFRGTVTRVGLLHLEVGPGVEMLVDGRDASQLEGVLRIPRSRIAGIQVL